MRQTKIALLALVGASLLAGAAAAQPAASRNQECFVRRNINGFSAPNDRTVFLRVGVKDIWRLDLFTTCPGLAFRNSFGLEDRPSSAWICSPLEATVVYREAGIRQRCPVSAMRKLTADEVAAMPKRDRP